MDETTAQDLVNAVNQLTEQLMAIMGQLEIIAKKLK